ncbi:MAG: chaperone modulator CbpM [Pseudomonadota bacterium]|jgi:chaperone modulatory protein CbpM|nr:MAG: MerR family transcriptional regulator [Pseudomonadota bacterium]
MSLEGKDILTAQLLGEDQEWTLEQVCGLFAVERQWILELVEQGVLAPLTVAGEPRFGGDALRRARIAVRLHRDLGVNAAGTALALELLERIEMLERELARRPA